MDQIGGRHSRIRQALLSEGRQLLEWHAHYRVRPYRVSWQLLALALPDHLKSFVDEQVAGRGYGTSSEYIRELIRRDQDRLTLRRLLLDGASSDQTEPVDADYFTRLRERVQGRQAE